MNQGTNFPGSQPFSYKPAPRLSEHPVFARFQKAFAELGVEFAGKMTEYVRPETSELRRKVLITERAAIMEMIDSMVVEQTEYFNEWQAAGSPEVKPRVNTITRAKVEDGGIVVHAAGSQVQPVTRHRNVQFIRPRSRIPDPPSPTDNTTFAPTVKSTIVVTSTPVTNVDSEQPVAE